ncbi:universal stress protein [Leeuwenhoekiella marinoflava]|uniref:Nucleotide-binding universal stress UspA family protein n=2 Tax=Leeuwenhoekiella marinoflava TaxID=988 RepID=A0A4Q0PMI8_9FLAO|nr:universal stress protein [Leeuwenhoekiella marinoflava]RXG31623.1 nucleotide-binding universal stress UspA family protein [Leeuwenhoekiella marinoflava]SHF10592.1 Nucleotide-binding universal stress protein, UspA family [Leeuwenhoekiella marinoflava DSM 3653]
MIKKLLVPTDFSEQADQAFEVACQLAKRYNAQLHLIHLIEFPHTILESVTGTQRFEPPEALFFLKMAQKSFQELKSQPCAKGIEIIEMVKFNNIYQGILDYAKSESIDTIIMGSHGTSGFEELFIGSNTEKIVRHATRPVLVIKKQHIHFKVKTLVFATDLDDDNVKPLKKAFEFAEAEEATLKLVYINTPDRFETTEKITSLFETFSAKINKTINDFEIYNDLKVERGIMNYAKNLNADLIAIGTHGRKGLAHFFNGSLSEDLVNHAKRPVLTFKI